MSLGDMGAGRAASLGGLLAVIAILGFACSSTDNSTCPATEPSGESPGFCGAVGPCFGGVGFCTGVICPACSAADGEILWSSDPFAGTCADNQLTCTLAELECFADAGPAPSLSASCAAAIVRLVEHGLDGGLGSQ
jgi:hypothetical protein